MGNQYGKLRQWWWLLPLQLQCYERLRSDCAGGYICAWVSAYERGADVRNFSAAEEDEAHSDYAYVVQEVEGRS